MGPPSWPVALAQATRSTPPKATAQKKRNPPEQFGAFGGLGPAGGINGQYTKHRGDGMVVDESCSTNNGKLVDYMTI